MNIILTPFMYAAGCGLVLALSEHISTLLGLPSPLGDFSEYLFFGLFVVWLPTVLVATRLAKDFKQNDFWKAVLRGCPKWMKYTAYFFFGYAFFNFILSAIMEYPDRIGSGHLMAFYFAAMATLYSAIHAKERDAAKRCLNGHPVSPSAKFCEQCGAKAIDSQELR